MGTITNRKKFTVEEYIQHELKAERRSEFINGQLFEMPGEKDTNNRIAFLLSMIFYKWLDEKGYQIFSHDLKVAIPNEDKFFYPDVFVTKEVRTEKNQYIKFEPELIVEVVSPSSQGADYSDKYIEYSKIPSLLYYLIVEPETTLVSVYEKTANNSWEISKFSTADDLVVLGKLGISFLLSDIYK